MKKSIKKELDDCRKCIADSLNRWKFIQENGCSDPAWPDGTNMNLLRNHIICCKARVSEICSQEGLSVPKEYYFPVPPEVDNHYMADLEQKDRVERLKQFGNSLTTERVEFDEKQLNFF